MPVPAVSLNHWTLKNIANGYCSCECWLLWSTISVPLLVVTRSAQEMLVKGLQSYPMHTPREIESGLHTFNKAENGYCSCCRSLLLILTWTRLWKFLISFNPCTFKKTENNYCSCEWSMLWRNAFTPLDASIDRNAVTLAPNRTVAGLGEAHWIIISKSDLGLFLDF